MNFTHRFKEWFMDEYIIERIDGGKLFPDVDYGYRIIRRNDINDWLQLEFRSGGVTAFIAYKNITDGMFGIRELLMPIVQFRCDKLNKFINCCYEASRRG